MNKSDRIISRIETISGQAIPDSIRHTIKRCILDYVGVVVAGSKANKNEIDKCVFFDSGSSPIFGTGITTDLLSAAMINGFNAHIFELDDGHRYGMLHLGAEIITSVFLVANKRNVLDADRLLKSIWCGYETAIELAQMLQPEHRERGFHASGTCGTIGVAMAIGVLLNYDRDELKRTLSMAVTSAAGLLNVTDGASELKPYNIGRAAMDGIAASILGKCDFDYPDDPICGDRGLISSLSSQEKECCLKDGNLNNIERIYTKPYASCRHCHPVVEAGIFLREELLDLGEDIYNSIEKVTISTYKQAIKGHDHIKIEGIQSAKLSIPYSFSTALLFGEGGFRAYSDELLNNRLTKDLMEKIDIKEYEPYTKMCPQKRVAEVAVCLANNTIISRKVEYPLGEPENPMTDKQLEVKCKDLLSYAGYSEESGNCIIKLVWNFEENISELFRSLR